MNWFIIKCIYIYIVRTTAAFGHQQIMYTTHHVLHMVHYTLYMCVCVCKFRILKKLSFKIDLTVI